MWRIVGTSVPKTRVEKIYTNQIAPPHPIKLSGNKVPVDLALFHYAGPNNKLPCQFFRDITEINSTPRCTRILCVSTCEPGTRLTVVTFLLPHGVSLISDQM